MARTSPFAKLFGHSPFKPMQQHIAVVLDCADQIPGLFEALCAGDTGKVAEIKDRIFDLEQQADDIKNELRAHLPKSLMMPVDRRDLLEVLDMQDSIADTAQDIAGLLIERPMEVPPGLKEPLLAFSRRSLEARLGRVFFRFLGATAASASSSRSFSRQSSTLRDWSRYRWLLITSSPSVVIRRRFFCMNRWRTASGRLGESATGQRSVALVFTLFTFWPPGPPLRANVKLNSLSGMRIRLLTTSMERNSGRKSRSAAGFRYGHCKSTAAAVIKQRRAAAMWFTAVCLKNSVDCTD